MKDYKVYIDLDTTNNLLRKLVDLDCVVFEIEGGLNDTYLINTEHLQESHKLGRAKFRKYMILGHEFANEWNNHLYVQMTDNEKLFNELYEWYEEQVQEQIQEQEQEQEQWYS